MVLSNNYKALSPETLGQRLSALDVMKQAVGSNADAWTVREVGDGNLNLVFIVEGDAGSVIVKQALPYVRLVGDSWPLPLKRAFFEYHALIRQEARDPGSVPRILHFDESQALIIMERLYPHIILRQQTMEGRKVAGLGRTLGQFAARTAFRGSDLSMKAGEKKADAALFAGNVELCDITETLVFTDPYYDAEMNRHTTPQLDGIVADLRRDEALKVEVQHMKRAFTSRGETMCHGDLHAGSIMVTETESRIIDPEFAFYGPFGFDIGMLIGNYLMAYHAMPAHISDADVCHEFQNWILEVIEETWSVFCAEFLLLWRTERTGILYPKVLYEDQGQVYASESAAQQLLGEIFRDLLGFAGIEMHRRILGLAHVAELDTIEDEDLKAKCEAKCLKLGQMLVMNRNRLTGMDAVIAAARQAETEGLA
ncbi:S-methyl-5-thioribose kinase [Hoeflea sp. IMCC20628]|uniref:S-methyl-5-thioribose kinase n=1 Tax=Hoeflea sp. IMCC20628 TaxID=1620421 RepID=UPI00063AB506|nr:S-methyl-5-thioribose kinase [Hoeflea sp. IMCC20628]